MYLEDGVSVSSLPIYVSSRKEVSLVQNQEMAPEEASLLQDRQIDTARLEALSQQPRKTT